MTCDVTFKTIVFVIVIFAKFVLDFNGIIASNRTRLNIQYHLYTGFLKCGIFVEDL